VKVIAPINGAITLSLGGGGVHLSVAMCGARAITAVTTNAGEAAHRKIVASIACKPDPELEQGTASLDVWIDLPGYLAIARSPGSVELESEEGYVMLRRQPTTHLDAAFYDRAGDGMLASLAFPAKRGPRRGELLTFTATIDGVERPGFLRFVNCTTSATLILVVAASDASAATLEKKGALARCLRPGEPPLAWADAPPVEEPAGESPPAGDKPAGLVGEEIAP
jgi:hypothetical protein